MIIITCQGTEVTFLPNWGKTFLHHFPMGGKKLELGKILTGNLFSWQNCRRKKWSTCPLFGSEGCNEKIFNRKRKRKRRRKRETERRRKVTYVKEKKMASEMRSAMTEIEYPEMYKLLIIRWCCWFRSDGFESHLCWLDFVTFSGFPSKNSSHFYQE